MQQFMKQFRRRLGHERLGEFDRFCLCPTPEPTASQPRITRRRRGRDFSDPVNLAVERCFDAEFVRRPSRQRSPRLAATGARGRRSAVDFDGVGGQDRGEPR